MDLLQTHQLSCPYCGENIQLVIDCSESSQEYIEDCQVCCRPITVFVTVENDDVHLQVMHENE